MFLFLYIFIVGLPCSDRSWKLQTVQTEDIQSGQEHAEYNS